MVFIKHKWENINMKKIFFGFVCILLLSSATFYAIRKVYNTHFVHFTDANTAIFGRYEKMHDGIAFSQSGTQLNFATNATDIEILITNQSLVDTSNWFSILLNNELYHTLILKPGKHSYVLKFPETDSLNLISFVKSTESFVGTVVFHGITVQKDSRIASNLNKAFNKMLHIQFIGNSITCGYGNMVDIPAPPEGNPNVGFHSINENAFESYAMKTTRALNAIPMFVSFSGIGLCRNYDLDTVSTMPKIYNRIHLQNEKSLYWDHKLQAPNLIVINLGTNDYSGESKNMPVNDSVFVQTYIQFIEQLIKMHPRTKIICSSGSMMSDDWPTGKNCLTRIRNNIKQIEHYFDTKENKKVYTFFFDEQEPPFGENFHPSRSTHTKMAKELSTFIKSEVIKYQ
jgi:lysophospholipase L1-like esterase